MTTKTYKYKSKIATAIGAVATIITIVGQEQLAAIFPGYGQYIPIIVAAASWYLAQTTENKRVEVAEQMLLEQFSKLVPIEDVDPASEYEPLNDEYTTGCEEDGC